MVSFIHNGSEITTWMGHITSKPKAQIPSNTFKKNYIVFEFQAADH